jgi:hypothetical protein
MRSLIALALVLLAAVASPCLGNRLAKEKSPYLLQHANNPVDWYPWGDEAFSRARAENKPIFLSIGYSSCHWCHVMEQESFSDPLVGEMMNATFVSIKVDREERPDIDNIYMTVSQMLTGGGGWPLNIIMTPDKKPFFASTYIPKEERFGRPGMLVLIPAVAKAWHDQHEQIVASAEKITAALRQARQASSSSPSKEILEAARRQFESRFDPVRGGFLPAPKFPSPHQLMFLLRSWKRTGNPKALQMVEKTLGSMRRGGIFDHLGFGFHRYSTDAQWLVPHFEKMLYDQAMLAMAYTEAFQATGKREYQSTAKEIFAYVLRDMRDPSGGFYSAEDADSEGKEGKFYLWTEEEIRGATGDDAALVIEAFGVRKEGNFRSPAGEVPAGANVLHVVRLSVPQVRQRLETSRQKLFALRERRIHPQKDDKVLADWNGLMIAALAKGAAAFEDPEALAAAKAAADFVLTRMRRNGKLLHRYRAEEAAIDGKLDDYAFVTWGLLELYEASFDTRYLQEAIDLTRLTLRDFPDREGGGFFMTATTDEKLLARPKDGYDGAIPSGNSVMMHNLLRLGSITGESEYEKQAQRIAGAFSADLLRAPTGHAQMLSALDFAFGPSREIVIAGAADAPDTVAMLRALRALFIPNKVVLFRPAAQEKPPIAAIAPFTEAQRSIRKRATAYVCTNFTCKKPTTSVAEFKALLQAR